MLSGRALFMIPSFDPRSLAGAMLGELLVVYEGSEARRKEIGRIKSYVDGRLLSAQLGDPEHLHFLLVIENISLVKEIRHNRRR